MSFIVWKDDYSVGVEKIDQQHQYLFHLINKLYVAVKNGFEMDIFDKLFDYAKEHFEEEEAIMLKNDYYDYKPHVKQHKYFVKKVESMLSMPKVEQDMLIFLRQWLTQHILQKDKKLGLFLRDQDR